MPQKNRLTIMMGLPRAGKGTWIASKKGHDDIVVSTDWIRENILGHSYSDASNAIVWAMVDSTLRIVLGQGKNAILDGINLTKSVRKFYVDIARTYGAEVRIVYIRTGLGDCVERNRLAESHKLPEPDLIEMGKIIEIPTKDEYDIFTEVYL
jgi:predicted kinase